MIGDRLSAVDRTNQTNQTDRAEEAQCRSRLC